MGIIKSGIKKIKDTYDYVASGGNKRKKRVRRGRVNIKATATSAGSAAIRAARQAKPKTPAQSSATTRMQGSKAKKWNNNNNVKLSLNAYPDLRNKSGLGGVKLSLQWK